jgi:hypothetical protein
LVVDGEDDDGSGDAGAGGVAGAGVSGFGAASLGDAPSRAVDARVRAVVGLARVFEGLRER